MTDLQLRKSATASWEILRDGQPSGLTIERHDAPIHRKGCRWEWAVMEDRTVLTSVFQGGAQAALAQFLAITSANRA